MTKNNRFNRPSPLDMSNSPLDYSPVPHIPLINKKSFLFNTIDLKKYYNKVECENNNLGYIFGKNGNTIKNIQKKNNTSIIWKKNKNSDHGYFLIKGFNLNDVYLATINIQQMIIKVQYKLINK